MTELLGSRRVVSREGLDYYPTPFWATEALLHYEKFDGVITEPCCGEGYMSKCLERHNYVVQSSDLNYYNYGDIKDAFSIQKAENIITNPPYNIADDLLPHFFKNH